MTVATGAAAPRASASLVASRTGGVPRVAAISVLVVSWALAALAIGITAWFGLPFAGVNDFSSLFLLNAVIWGAVSALLIARRAHPVGVVLAVMAIGSGISAVGTQVAALGIDGTGLLEPGIVQHVYDRFWLPGTLASYSFLPLLLTSRPIARWTKALVAVGTVASVLPFLLTIVRQRPGAAPNPLAIADPVVQDLLVAGFTASLTVAVAVAVASGIVLLWRWRLGPRDDRRGLGWLVLAQWLLVVFLSPSFLGWWPAAAAFLDAQAPFAPFVAVLFMPAAVIVTALGQRLWGIEVAVNRAVVTVLLFAALVAAYAFIATSLTAVLPLPPTIAGVIGVVVLALGFDPLQRWIQRRVDSLVYGDAAEPAQLIRSLGARLGGEADLQALAAALRETLRLGRIEIRSLEPGGPVAVVGAQAGPATTIQLRSADRVVGRVVASAPGRQRLDRRTRHVLEQIAGVLALSVQLGAINRDLAEARDRVLEVGEEEQRMVRRELHGGLAPALAADAARLEAAQTAAPAAVHGLLAEVRTDLALRTNEVRDLARTLLPGALDSGDLDAALRDLADRFAGPALEIEVATSDAERLDPVRQAAIHHLAAETVLLARRGPAGASVSVHVDAVEQLARIIARIDGRVDPASAAPTLGSIDDRAQELGGSLRREDDDDDSTFTIEVPL